MNRFAFGFALLLLAVAASAQAADALSNTQSPLVGTYFAGPDRALKILATNAQQTKLRYELVLGAPDNQGACKEGDATCLSISGTASAGVASFKGDDPGCKLHILLLAGSLRIDTLAGDCGAGTANRYRLASGAGEYLRQGIGGGDLKGTFTISGYWLSPQINDGNNDWTAEKAKALVGQTLSFDADSITVGGERCPAKLIKFAPADAAGMADAEMLKACGKGAFTADVYNLRAGCTPKLLKKFPRPPAFPALVARLSTGSYVMWGTGPGFCFSK